MREGIAHAAEELVRAGGGASIEWHGARVGTHFQPIFAVRRRACLGFEALARVRDVEGRAGSAESLFASVPAGSRGLLDWACRALHLRNFATMDPGDRMLFINVHPEAALADIRCARELAGLIRYYGLTPRRLCIEILEAACSDDGALREAVLAYREIGACIALDDFGVACSDLERVRRLRPDIVKLDRSVIGSCAESEGSRASLRAMVGELHASGAKVAIEGVETGRQLAWAIESGADYVQGIHLAPPGPHLLDEAPGTQAWNRSLGGPERLAA
ncbi:MAG TPA: EAL domain-containing protein [Usitatibacter sp.]|nr:EAL domain-containing protein [Usitatibacter sp.]